MHCLPSVFYHAVVLVQGYLTYANEIRGGKSIISRMHQLYVNADFPYLALHCQCAATNIKVRYISMFASTNNCIRMQNAVAIGNGLVTNVCTNVCVTNVCATSVCKYAVAPRRWRCVRHGVHSQHVL